MKRYQESEREVTRMDTTTKTAPQQEQQNQSLNGEQQPPPSPREFFEEVMRRPDITELLARLAKMDEEDKR